MTKTTLENVLYLHDATISEFALFTGENGDRGLRMRLRCDTDCGYDEWNGKTIQVLFVDPLIVNGELFGHMANVDSFNSWGKAKSTRIIEQIERMKDVGIPAPLHLVELVFHSGSVFEVACDEVRIDVI